jgi:transitional endoplasmic reticulum ATPase
MQGRRSGLAGSRRRPPPARPKQLLAWAGAHRSLLRRAVRSLGIAVALGQWLLAFPISSWSSMALMVVVLAALTAWNVRAGMPGSLVALFLMVAFYDVPLAYLFAALAVPMALATLVSNSGAMVTVLLAPWLLRNGLGYVIPLAAGVFLKGGLAVALAAIASLACLGGMLVYQLPTLGPLALIREGATLGVLPVAAAAATSFFEFDWLGTLAAPGVTDAIAQFSGSAIQSPAQFALVFVQTVGWIVAAAVVSRVYRRGTWRRLVQALALAAGVLAVQILLASRLSGAGRGYRDAALRELVTASVLVAAVRGIPFPRRARGSASGDTAVEGFGEVEGDDSAFGERPGDLDFQAIGGLEDVKREIQMAFQHVFDKGSSKLALEYGLKTAKGILFYGPPGCGKTMLARVIARQTGAHFAVVSGADFRSKWYGEAERNIAKVFAEAREHAPSVIFFDEIEQLLGRRDQTQTSDSPERRVVAQFLSEMDGLKVLSNVVVVGATNEPDLIDPAALRPGRFDKLIYIPLPDLRGRESILRLNLAKKPLTADVDFGKLARLTERYSGADLADLCNKVAEQCVSASLQTRKPVPVSMAALEAQVKHTKPSVSLRLIAKYDELQEKYHRRTLRSETEDSEQKDLYTWEMIGGLDAVRQELVEAIETPLSKPELYERFRITPPRGVLLFGPPGCGKTLMAKIVAQQCSAKFLPVDAKKESAESIREWFIRARENKPCVLFFDEIDSIASARWADIGGGTGVVTQLLVELDGMKDLKQVVVVAATNRPDALDYALLRPGRFDRLIYIPPPEPASREQILRIHLHGKPVAADMDLAEIAARTENYSGADIAAVCYEAAMSLIRQSDRPESQIQQQDLLASLERVKPSIRAEDLAYFSEMKERFRRGSTAG